MSRRYDSKTTSFTDDGRLMQVEYAIEAINKTGTAIGVLTTGGIVLVTQKQDVSLLLEQSKQSEKIYKLDNHIYCVVSGITADANYLIDYARQGCQNYYYQYRSPMPLEQIIIRVCDLKQSYTQFGGLRPFGAAFLFAGYDKNHKFQLYSSDPSGNYQGWKATAIGQNNSAANSFLKEQYKEDISLEEGINMSLKAIVKTMDTVNPSPKKLEVLIITANPQTQEVQCKEFSENEIGQQLKANGFEILNEQNEQ